jgi:hypothetical protein
MAAPKFVPIVHAESTHAYESPDKVPGGWSADRPGDLSGRQPRGTRLGNQGPDQGFALRLAKQFHGRLALQADEHEHDAVEGALGVALARASLFGRAPVIHDLTIAFTIFGFLDATAPADLVTLRRPLFSAVGHVAHHDARLRAIVDSVPESTLRMTHQDLASAYPKRWRELLGR